MGPQEMARECEDICDLMGFNGIYYGIYYGLKPINRIYLMGFNGIYYGF